MKLLVNCSNLISGGGLTVGLGIVRSIYAEEKGNKYVLILPADDLIYPFKSTGDIKIIKLSNTDNSWIGKLFLQKKISKIAVDEKCNAVLSLSNYAIPINLPQTLLIHWPYAVYPEKNIWDNMSFINKIRRKIRLLRLKSFLKYADTIVVQTPVMKKRVEQNLISTKPISIIPSSTGFFGEDVNLFIDEKIKKLKEEGNKVLLCINEYYEHKNLEILIPLAKKIKKRKLKFDL